MKLSEAKQRLKAVPVLADPSEIEKVKSSIQVDRSLIPDTGTTDKELARLSSIATRLKNEVNSIRERIERKRAREEKKAEALREKQAEIKKQLDLLERKETANAS